MTGAEHYEEAERLLNGLDGFDHTDPEHQPIIAAMVAEAQVEATLAQAAATVDAANLVMNHSRALNGGGRS